MMQADQQLRVASGYRCARRKLILIAKSSSNF
jgi:hypothetical protein